MFRKTAAVLTALLVIFAASGCGTDPQESSSADVTPVAADATAFADGDTKDRTRETPDAVITLSGSSGTISDTTRGSSGSTVTVTSKGVYRVTGSSEGVTIAVNDTAESGNITLILDNVTMTGTSSLIYVQAADKVILQCVGENELTFSGSSAQTADGAVYAKDDLTVNGSGTLTIRSAAHGIVCKNDLKITGAVLTVEAEGAGLKAGDSVRIGGGTTSVTAGRDGIQVENSAGDSFFYMDGGTLAVDAGYDGIQVTSGGAVFTGYLKLAGGELSVTAGGGAAQSKNGSVSQKGLRCGGDILIGEARVTVDAADDAVHSGASVRITGGVLSASSSDDGIHADDSLTITGGSVTVAKSYEGLEAEKVTIAGGTVSITASDDGINAAGGSDTASTDKKPWSSSSATGVLTVSGGTVYVNAQGDGLDSNGSIYVTGGVTIVEGPSGSGNGALDKGDGSGCVASVTGGTVLAIGSTDMAVNFSAGTQCSALVSLSGSAGTKITVEDGSGFTFTATKSFGCIVYSSPKLTKGNSYTITAGSSSAAMDFSSSLYYSNVSGMGGPGH